MAVGTRFDRRALLGGDLSGAERARRERAIELAEGALAAVDAGVATERALDRLAERERLAEATLFAWGKAAGPMALAAARRLPGRGGLLVAPAPVDVPGLRTFVGGHPDPAPDVERTGRAFLEAGRALGPQDVALCLVSGGGSSLLELPRAGLSGREVARLASALRERGAAIEELNAVRRALSAIKGGGLARSMAPARIRNVVLSDVAPLPLAVVASGATCAPPAGPDPRAVLRRYGLTLPAAMASAEVDAESWDPAIDVRSELAADEGTARRAVAERGGLENRSGHFAGEARVLGGRLASIASGVGWVWGGETTVEVTGGGVGGRNQEVALGALAAGWSRGLLLCFGTDGIDGVSDAAGALVDAPAVRAAQRLALDPHRALAANDATAFFDAVGTTLRCGPTGTNVADLILYLP